ncbi:GNAT family N-acetyltransferase [Reyranella sp.]|uniref:GNAT family N-acetyltransferase n=1 Tax=Reyranella sp. TaxID=1929291 RepID=UPI003BABA55E
MSRPTDLDSVRLLEERAFAAWPALETVDRRGWRSRFAGGYTKRANSINALSYEPEVDDELIASLEKAYRDRGQTPVWRLTPLAPAGFEALLDDRGYRSIDPSLVQVCPLAATFAADPEVTIGEQPSEAWIEAFATWSPVRPEHRPVMRRMLAAIAAPVGFAFVEEAGRAMAMAIGVVDGDHMGLFDVLVMPHARRRGLARRVTESLYAWAWARGARFAYLQVVASNEAALPLYAAQGFRTVYRYAYRVPA